MLIDRFYKMHMLYMDEYTSCLDPVQEGFNPTQMGLFRAAHGWQGGRGGGGGAQGAERPSSLKSFMHMLQ